MQTLLSMLVVGTSCFSRGRRGPGGNFCGTVHRFVDASVPRINDPGFRDTLTNQEEL